MNDPHLARRIHRIEGRASIEDLLARYSIACDLRDFDALGKCFTDDGSFQSVAQKVSGRQNLIDYFKERFALYGPTYHVPHSVTIQWDEEDENRASGTVIAHSEIMFPEGLLVAAHHYVDEYARVGDADWRLVSRNNRFLYGAPLAELISLDPNGPRRRWPGTEPADADIPEGTETWRQFQKERASAAEHAPA